MPSHLALRFERRKILYHSIELRCASLQYPTLQFPTWVNRAAFGRDVRDFAAPAGGALNVGQFVVALDIVRFLPLDAFKAEVDRHIRDLSSSQRLPGVEEIREPGQGRLARRKEREQYGVPLAATLLAQVDEVAKLLGITPLSARA